MLMLIPDEDEIKIPRQARYGHGHGHCPPILIAIAHSPRLRKEEKVRNKSGSGFVSELWACGFGISKPEPINL